MQDDRVKVYSYNRRRIKYIFVMVCIAAAVIIGRLAYIMVLKAKYYSERADNLHERERSIKAPRGRIYDRNGNILADNRAVCSVSVIHSQIEDEEAVIDLLEKYLDKSPEEIFYQDFKKFIMGDVTFGVGQITSLDAGELESIKEQLLPQMESECGKHGIEMVFFMLTNIIEESTELLYYGSGAKEVIEKAFEDLPVNEVSCELKGVVSRKKQLIPAFMMALQNQ